MSELSFANIFSHTVVGKRGKGHQGTCIKDTWTKSKGDRIEGGRWGWMRLGE